MPRIPEITLRLRQLSRRYLRRGPAPKFGLVVRCATGAHKVRLQPQRFWRNARCPACKSPVDRTRTRRVAGLARDFFWTGLPKGPGRTVRVAGWSYLLFAVLAWAVLYGLGDRWWLGTLLLFGPRWLLLLPAGFLIPLALRLRVSAFAPVAAGMAVVLFPVMGLEVGWRSAFTRLTHDTDFRVITFNVKQSGMRLSALPALLDYDPDVIAFQECGKELGGLLEQMNGWHAHREADLCLLSRHPLERIDPMEREHLRQAGGAGNVIRFAIRTPERLVWLTNVHLDTPRAGLSPIRKGELGSGIDALRTKQFTRDIESKQARQWVDAALTPSTIVVGDFNMPVESVIYRRYWSDLRNAFSTAGVGFGATRDNGWIQARIDHVLTGSGWQPRRVEVGPTYGSDHRPVIADLAWVGD